MFRNSKTFLIKQQGMQTVRNLREMKGRTETDKQWWGNWLSYPEGAISESTILWNPFSEWVTGISYCS